MYKKTDSKFITNATIEERFITLVEEINKKYEQFKFLSNDELRNTARNLRLFVERSNDISGALNEKLPEAYALTKEVARRFSEGNIEVTANRRDIEISENNDFVLIKGDKAIYKNKWSVCEMPYQWDMIHYDEQLLGGILLHYGYAVEMATGEGKTLVATLPVFLNALSHAGVHMMTANNYLSKRDCEITRPIYIFFGLTVDCIEFYESQDVHRKDAYQADITFGTTSSFTFDYLWDHLATNPKECVQLKHNYAIIDELDSILIDDAETPHIVGGGQFYDDSKIYKDNIPYVRELIATENSEHLYFQNILMRSAGFTEAGHEWLRNKLNNKDLFKTTRIYQIENFDSLKDEEKEAIYSCHHLQNALVQLLRALTVYERDVDYVVTEDISKNSSSATIGIIDQNTGRLHKSRRWEHGLHTAIEVKEGVKPKLDFDGIGVISLKNYLRLYSKVAGMSGSIMAASDELSEIYGLKCATLPTHNPNIRIDYPLRVFRTCKDKDAAILDVVKKNQQSGCPTLLGCLTIKRSESFANLLRENGIQCNQLNATNEKDEALLVAQAGIGNTVTVSTSIAGRGTDIKPSGEVLERGGLLVIGADLFSSVRVDQQLKGRTGRQGNPGSSIFFASLEDAVLRYLSPKDKERLDALIAETQGQEITSTNIASYFTLAQSNREKFLRENRRAITRKDDIIAPKRKAFYEKRNIVLHSPNFANQIFEEIIETEGLQRDTINQRLKEIYALFTILLERRKYINPDFEKLSVPFSCQGQPFALSFYVRNHIYDFATFITDYKRQLILTTYDKYWKEFVLYILKDLDIKEIEGLKGKSNDMLREVNQELVKLISDSKIIFSPQKLEYNSPSPTGLQENNLPKKNSKILPDTACPCGSGKKYCECHGRNTRNKKRRRM